MPLALGLALFINEYAPHRARRVLIGAVDLDPCANERSHIDARHKLYGLEYLLASSFGAATPFCSCSSVPLFIGFVKGGIPLGVTFAFLITSPLVNEVAVAVMLGSFGVRTTAIYVATGIFLGIVSGLVLNALGLRIY